MIRILYTALFSFLFTSFCFAQTLLSNVRYQLEAGSYLSSSGQTPFWLRSNQYGVVPLESQFATFRGAAHREYDSTKNENKRIKKFGIGYGAWAVANVGKVNQLLLPEAYVKVRYGAFELYGGRRKEIVGLVDTALTSGSYVWSGNALPIPKLQISIPNYTSIIGHGLVSIKGSFAHGWFGSSDSTKNFFLHQKTLYGRIGKPNWRIKMYAGFNHQVQWGGRPYKPYVEKQTGKLITSYGNDFNTFLNVISGVSLNTKGGIDIPGIPLNDAWNRSGNHLGSIDLGSEICFNKLNLLIYRQSIYDDGSLYYLSNISDGLLGLSIKRINKLMGLLSVTIEYLNTSNQGGAESSGNFIPELRGIDNYFNNKFYGWVYDKNTIGTPFISPKWSVNSNINSRFNSLPISIASNLIINNRVRGIFLGFNYNSKFINSFTKLSYINNLGIYENILNIKQISLLEHIIFPFRKHLLNLTISYDSNGLFINKVGTFLSIQRFL